MLLIIELINKFWWVRYVGPRWRCKNQLISDILIWTSTHGDTSVDRPSKIYIDQLSSGISKIDIRQIRMARERERE